jgi:hypothetical protein
MSNEPNFNAGQGAEDQSSRWLKYGSNTVLVSVVVVALAVLLVYLAERKDHRTDTTASSLYSLKPQTVKLIEGNKQHITITSFYSKAKPGQAAYGTGDEAADADSATLLATQADHVADVLAEYAAQGKDITVENIDPKLNPNKADALIAQVTEQYGGEVGKYKEFTAGLNAKYDAIGKAADAQLAKIKQLPLDSVQSEELAQTLNLAILSVQDIPTGLKHTEETYQRYLHQKPPDYKGITDTVSENMTTLSTVLAKVIEDFGKAKDDKSTPPAIRQYMVDSAPAYAAMKKQADDLIAQIKGLGELKLDTIREAIHQDNAILVRGDKDWKVIRYDQVWKADTRDARSAAADAPVHPRFTGEQAITTAILALNQPVKMKMCFVRAGGEPLAASGGMFSSLADRLRDYNFEITDKDLTGQYQMQAMQQQQPAPPEPSDADIDDAVWVVSTLVPQQQNPMMGGPPPSIAAKVAEHLAHGHHWADGKRVDGGCAMVLGFPRGDTMADALTPFGLSLRTDAIAVHAQINTDAGAADAGDTLNAVEKYPPIFGITDWGKSPITDSLNGLPGVLVAAVPVQAVATPGATSHLLIPVPGAPDSPASWGETDLDSINKSPKFGKDDMPGPLFAAGESERADGSRLVVAGGESFAGADVPSQYVQNIVDLPDPQLAKQHVFAPWFPGNGELFMNASFWLAHEEPMIAISPAAMTVARIGPMTKAKQNFWHVGVLLVGLPGLVLAAGVAAYVSRQS